MEAGLARPDTWRKLLRVLEDIKAESDLLGIPTVDFGDGLVLESMAFSYAVSGGTVFADIGAGVGYSTAWIALGVEAGCAGKCRVYAVEKLPGRAERLRKLKGKLGLTRVEVDVVEADALEFLESLEDSSLSLAFVDVEKHLYLPILRLLERKLASGGAALFHNAFYPKPPGEFYEAVANSPWKATIAPSPVGMIVAILRPRDSEL